MTQNYKKRRKTLIKSITQQLNRQFERMETHHSHFEFTTAYLHAFDSYVKLNARTQACGHN